MQAGVLYGVCVIKWTGTGNATDRPYSNISYSYVYQIVESIVLWATDLFINLNRMSRGLRTLHSNSLHPLPMCKRVCTGVNDSPLIHSG